MSYILSDFVEQNKKEYKRIFAYVFIRYLEKHHQVSAPEWNINDYGSQDLINYYNLCIIAYDESQFKGKILELELDKLDKITGFCTQAMDANLIARLIQDQNNEDVPLESGIHMLFAKEWNATKGFILYIKGVMLEMQNKKLIEDEVRTLDYDPFKYCYDIINY